MNANKNISRRDPLDVFGTLLDAGRRWDDVLRRHVEADRMIVPAVDISESPQGLTVSAELPGLKKDEVKLTIEDGVLTLSGEKKFEEEKKGKDYHRVERRYGSFHRSFTLPTGIDADQAKARFEDGVLTVEIPKSEAAKPKHLTIE